MVEVRGTWNQVIPTFRRRCVVGQRRASGVIHTVLGTNIEPVTRCGGRVHSRSLQEVPDSGVPLVSPLDPPPGHGPRHAEKSA